MSERLNRFLGDTPLRVVVRLILLSFLVGLTLSVLNIHPYWVFTWLRRLLWRVYDMGFLFFEDAFNYLLVGAMLVVPIFLLSRLLKAGSRSGPRPD